MRAIVLTVKRMRIMQTQHAKMHMELNELKKMRVKGGESKRKSVLYLTYKSPLKEFFLKKKKTEACMKIYVIHIHQLNSSAL